MNISSLTSKHVFYRWLPFAAVATIMSAIVFGAVQQDLRLSANDPQIQMAEDAADAISGGQQIPPPPASASIDIAKNLSPFLAIYDDQGKVLATNAKLGANGFPTLPAGVFAYVRAHNEDRITWQPQPGVRIATVIHRFQGKTPGFILAGRSLREVEMRIAKIEMLVGLGWLVALVATYLLVACNCRDKKKEEEEPATLVVVTEPPIVV